MNFWGVGSVGNVGSVGKSMIFQHSQCFQCFQCSKKRGTPLKIPPHCERSSHQTQRRGAHKLHKGETARQGRQHSTGRAHKLHKDGTARQGRQHSAEKRTSSAGRQERQLRNEGGRLSEVATLAVIVLEAYY